MPDLIGKAKDAMGKKEDKDAQPGNKVEGGADNAANDRMSLLSLCPPYHYLCVPREQEPTHIAVTELCTTRSST